MTADIFFIMFALINTGVMRKLFTLLLICVFITNISYAQNRKAREYDIYLEASAGLAKSFDPAISLRGVLNYLKNDQLYVGGGVGLFYMNHKIMNYGDSKNYYPDFSIEIPVFVKLRGYLSKNESSLTPYYSLSAGYIFPLKRAVSEYSTINKNYNNGYDVVRVSNFSKGLFLAPEFGVSYKNMSYSVELMYLTNCLDAQIDTYIYNYHHKTNYNSEETPNYIISFKIVNRL